MQQQHLVLLARFEERLSRQSPRARDAGDNPARNEHRLDAASRFEQHAAQSAGHNTVSGVVAAAVARMGEHGATELTAWIGPHVCGACYEVPGAMRDEVAATAPTAWAETSWGTPALDLGAAVSAQLSQAGARVVDASRCTREHDDLYSYRRDGADAGRMAGLIRLGS